MATFLANEINATDRDAAGPIDQVQIMFPLRWFPSKRTRHRFSMKLGMVSLQYKERTLKT